MNLLDNISDQLNVPHEMLIEALAKSQKYVKHIKLKKRDGSLRTVYQPSKKLKIIQYWLIDQYFSKLNIHPAAMGFINNRSIIDNARVHKKGKYFLKLDFKDFFPSIKYSDLAPIQRKWILDTKDNTNIQDLLSIIKHSCFYPNDSLPIGYPTSPIISNIVMYNFDTKIFNAVSDVDEYGIVQYTRYADDITFSTNKKGACNSILKFVTDSLNKMTSPNLKLNPKKIHFVSSAGGSSMVTGLRICHDGHITIHRDYKDKIRLLFSLYIKGLLSKEQIMSLKGHLSYIKHVDSAFYTKLQKKYFIQIKDI